MQVVIWHHHQVRGQMLYLTHRRSVSLLRDLRCQSAIALNNRPRQRATCPSWRAQAYQSVNERKIGLRARVGSAQVGTAVVGAISLAPKPSTPERCGDNGLSVRDVAALQRPLRDRHHHNRVTDHRASFRLSLSFSYLGLKPSPKPNGSAPKSRESGAAAPRAPGPSLATVI
jgi:hypothetical protein